MTHPSQKSDIICIKEFQYLQGEYMYIIHKERRYNGMPIICKTRHIESICVVKLGQEATGYAYGIVCIPNENDRCAQYQYCFHCYSLCLGEYNTKEEADEICEALAEAMKRGQHFFDMTDPYKKYNDSIGCIHSSPI